MPRKKSTPESIHLNQLRRLRRDIGRRIQCERHVKRMTLEELANRSKVGAGTLDQFELGFKVINLEMLAHIARVLNVPLSAFIGLEKAKDRF